MDVPVDCEQLLVRAKSSTSTSGHTKRRADFAICEPRTSTQDSGLETANLFASRCLPPGFQ